MRILAIDPGSAESGWLILADGRPERSGTSPNEQLVAALRHGAHADVVVIEQLAPRYGLQMGWATLDTARWVGRFEEAAQQPVVLLRRSVILRHLGVVTSPRKGEKRVSADSGVNQALRDRFGGAAAKGTKAAPGPLYGVTGDAWSALAVAVSYSEGAR